MRVKEFITEADFAAWKNNRNLNAPAGATLAQANKNAGTAPQDSPGTLADLAKLGAPQKPQGSTFGDKMDWLKGQLYRFGGGKFGQEGNLAATKNIFINNFVQEYNQIMGSARRSGMGQPDLKTYISDYLQQYNWAADPAEIDKIVAGSGNNIRNVANGVYVIGMRNTRGGQKSGVAKQNVAQMTPTTAGGQQVDLGAGTEKIIQAVTKMSGTTNADDLEKIALAAMNKLYGINKSEYANLRQSILQGKQAETPQAQQPVAESRSKTRKFSNRTK